MAQQAGMARVAVGYGAHHPDQLLPYKPLACLERFSELITVITAVKSLIAKNSR
jgi:hypothetical protein